MELRMYELRGGWLVGGQVLWLKMKIMLINVVDYGYSKFVFLSPKIPCLANL